MKLILRKILFLVMMLVSRVYSYNISSGIQLFFHKIYTLWIQNFIGQLGVNSYIYYPCRLWGGGNKHIVIGANSTIQAHCILGCWAEYQGESFTPSISIGNNCNIGEYAHISSIKRITIGDGLLTGRYVYIGDNNHGGLCLDGSKILPINRKLISKGEIVIGSNVWIGDKVSILSGVHIGNNVIVAANAVVTKDFPSNTIIGGNPAQIIKMIENG